MIVDVFACAQLNSQSNLNNSPIHKQLSAHLTWQMLLLQAHTLAEHAPAVGLLESKNVLFCENVSPHPAVTAIKMSELLSMIFSFPL